MTSNRRRSSMLASIVAPEPPPTIRTRFITLTSPAQDLDDGDDLVRLVLDRHDLVPRLGGPRLNVRLHARVGGPQFDDVAHLRAAVGQRQVGDRSGARRPP